MLTDSGGFQMVSLLHLADITERGVEFQSPTDGSRMLLTPEESMAIQNGLGADIIMQVGALAGGRCGGPVKTLLESLRRAADRQSGGRPVAIARCPIADPNPQPTKAHRNPIHAARRSSTTSSPPSTSTRRASRRPPTARRGGWTAASRRTRGRRSRWARGGRRLALAVQAVSLCITAAPHPSILENESPPPPTHATTHPPRRAPQSLFPIVQGGFDARLRDVSMQQLVERGCPGHAIGGLAGGEGKDVFWRVVAQCTAGLPPGKPRYVMGIGYPLDIVVCRCAAGSDWLVAFWGCLLVPARKLTCTPQFTSSLSPHQTPPPQPPTPTAKPPAAWAPTCTTASTRPAPRASASR